MTFHRSEALRPQTRSLRDALPSESRARLLAGASHEVPLVDAAAVRALCEGVLSSRAAVPARGGHPGGLGARR